MLKKNIIIGFMVFALLIAGCRTEPDKITNVSDYAVYIDSKQNNDLKAQKEYTFWKEKLETRPNQFPYLPKMAAAHAQLFEATGKIDHLKMAEENLKLANRKTLYNNASYLRALARNYISQHRFKESLELLSKAEENGEKLVRTQKMLFDVHLELGNEVEAEKYLKKFKDLNDFDYLIRLAKWSDHQGNLNHAITYFEMAKRIAEASKNSSRLQWIYSNLGDVYGHAFKIEKSYEHYLKALQLNPDDAYSKKGIAWIIYSYERNPKEALRILNSITQYNTTPDYYLLKAEIAEFMGDFNLKETYLDHYLNLVVNKKYGVMYNKYNAFLYADEFNNAKHAMAIANKEVEERPTPQSYDLLAWSFFKAGQKGTALKIIEDHVLDKTFEPSVQYHIAEVYKANGMGKFAKKIKKELLESTYELGPLLEEKIKLL